MNFFEQGGNFYLGYNGVPGSCSTYTGCTVPFSFAMCGNEASSTCGLGIPSPVIPGQYNSTHLTINSSTIPPPPRTWPPSPGAYGTEVYSFQAGQFLPNIGNVAWDGTLTVVARWLTVAGRHGSSYVFQIASLTIQITGQDTVKALCAPGYPQCTTN